MHHGVESSTSNLEEACKSVESIRLECRLTAPLSDQQTTAASSSELETTTTLPVLESAEHLFEIVNKNRVALRIQKVSAVTYACYQLPVGTDLQTYNLAVVYDGTGDPGHVTLIPRTTLLDPDIEYHSDKPAYQIPIRSKAFSKAPRQLNAWTPHACCLFIKARGACPEKKEGDHDDGYRMAVLIHEHLAFSGTKLNNLWSDIQDQVQACQYNLAYMSEPLLKSVQEVIKKISEELPLEDVTPFNDCLNAIKTLLDKNVCFKTLLVFDFRLLLILYFSHIENSSYIC
jgi:hypothetical protein